MMKSPTRKWLKAQIRDERKSARMYMIYGFPEMAKDEKRHMSLLKRKLKMLG